MASRTACVRLLPAQLPGPQLQQRHDVGACDERVGDDRAVDERQGGGGPAGALAEELGLRGERRAVFEVFVNMISHHADLLAAEQSRQADPAFEVEDVLLIIGHRDDRKAVRVRRRDHGGHPRLGQVLLVHFDHALLMKVCLPDRHAGAIRRRPS